MPLDLSDLKQLFGADIKEKKRHIQETGSNNPETLRNLSVRGLEEAKDLEQMTPQWIKKAQSCYNYHFETKEKQL